VLYTTFVSKHEMLHWLNTF